MESGGPLPPSRPLPSSQQHPVGGIEAGGAGVSGPGCGAACILGGPLQNQDPSSTGGPSPPLPSSSAPLSLPPPRPQVLTVDMLPSLGKWAQGAWSFEGPTVLPLRRLRLEGAVRMPPAPTQGTARPWPLESSRLLSHPPHRLPPCWPQMISGVGLRSPGQGRGIFLLPQAQALFLPCSPHSPRAPDGPRDPHPLPGKPRISTLGIG